MQQLTAFFEELAVLYLIAAAGYTAKRAGILGKAADDALTRLILYITLPALIIFSMDFPFEVSLIKDFAILMLLSVFALGAAILAAYFFIKKGNISPDKEGVQQGLIIFGNQGFLGYAICQVLFLREGIMYAAVFNILYLALIWTYGIYIIAKDTFSFRWKMAVLNPGTIATAIGLLVFLLPLEWPAVINKYIQSLGAPATPLSMLLIGSFMAGLDNRKVWQISRDMHIWWAVFIKLLLLPMLVMLFAFLNIDFMILAVAVLITAMPSAPTISLYANKYGGDVSYASAGVCISTLLLPVTLPFLYWLLNAIYRLVPL